MTGTTTVNMETVERYRRMAPQAVGWLLTQAHERNSLAYKEFAEAMGVHWRGRQIGWLLYEVARYCHDHGLPNLSAMVVNAADGSVSEGYWMPGSEDITPHPFPMLPPEQERTAIQAWVAADLRLARDAEVG